TRLSETYLAESELGNEMDDTSESLIVQITLLTVSLSLYGLSLALKGRVRWLFVAVGSSIVGFCAIWLSWSLIELIGRSEVNQNAINAYSEGVGLSYQGRYEEAIEKFDIALQENTYYAKAYYERGNAYYSLGDLNTAIADMEDARFWGLDEDVSVNWNLGWTYYLNGQYPKAIEVNEVVLSKRPEVIGVRSNQAISYLVMGDFANAQAQYDLLLQEAQFQVNEARQRNAEPSASLWLYMDYGAQDLQSLIDTLESNQKPWTQAPQKDLIAGDHAAIREFALEQMKRIKEAIVALEYTGQLPAPNSATQIDSFRVGSITGRNEENLISGFEPARNAVIPYGEDTFDIEFTYSGAVPEQVIWKVYINGREDQSLRKVLNQDISAGDTWYQTFGYGYTNVFILASGEYVVELYADNKFLSSITFSVR
ncbi:MAG TPA: tetratricopeptide repeat protein, partial [Anaerolineales bacterium]|nr:tetratricopeptide repeat protein [Anaerolineales bacterium]